MNYKMLFLILAMCGVYQMQAQFSIGVTTGANLSTVNITGLGVQRDGNQIINYAANTETSIAIYQYIAIVPKFQLSEKISISTNIEYSLKGYQSPFFSNFSEEKTHHRIAYLDFIPKIEYSPVKFISIGIGGFFGKKIQESYRENGASWKKNGFVDLHNDSDFGITGSIRGNFKNFFLMVGYNHGLKNISDVQLTDVNGDDLNVEMLSRNIQIGMGYFFEVKKNS